MISKIRMMYSTAAGATLLLMVFMVPAAQQEYVQSYGSCNCDSGIELDNSLPLSHPTNRCAIGQQQDVSWLSWLKGGNQSVQFHFLDLLELLSRHAEPGKDQRTAS